MNEFEQQIKNAWVEYLVASKKKEAAAIATNCEINFKIEISNSDSSKHYLDYAFVGVPVTSLAVVNSNESIKSDLVSALITVMYRQYYPEYQLTFSEYSPAYIEFYASLTHQKDKPVSTWRRLFKWLAII